ncbi:mitochondrial matrix iron-sulfur protein [Purpureocillium takamizusanense]|uniref:Mitochondrial matrix iron-sulfur protein n=1 Tax=Purpureocillium takamizusanense TaxID=2060973 RepID=A0A9Q8QFJ2_9HYPO|nr:mitochondrial matrix iron-sulfur protein [Purpureocillium takamizusanense]UNI18745.1 mitochondrial matrix iron-sulfur protein [Purpureocillium takamizusanense]
MPASRSVAAGLACLPTVACRSLQPGRVQMKTASLASSFAAQSKPSSVPRWAWAVTPARRAFTTTTPRRHGHIEPPKPGQELYVTFIEKDGMEHKFAVSEGDNLLDIAQANDLEMEGACGGSCACSTCHVIVVDEDKYDKMPEPEDDENDMLDLAFGLTETSRLGCQVKMTKELDGLVVKLPSMTRNLQASDFQ